MADNDNDSPQDLSKVKRIQDIVSNRVADTEVSNFDDRPVHRDVRRTSTDESDYSVSSDYLDSVREFVPGLEEREGAMGGYIALADLSQRKSFQKGTQEVFNPSALGLKRTTSENSLYEHILNNRLELKSVVGAGYNCEDAIRIEVSNLSDGDLFVVIEPGTVFERGFDDRIQNLVTRDRYESKIGKGTHQISLYGLCMDSNAAAPGGENMSLTPWICQIHTDSQDSFWSFTDPSEGE